MKPVSSFIRPIVRKLHPYIPGEQPKIKGLVKLNTNENPYPPSPKVLAAIKQATDQRLRLYPNPTAEPLRQVLAKYHVCKTENIIVGNGSDELLAMAVRCFVEPRRTVQFFTPGYSLYPVLAEMHGARINRVPLKPNFDFPSHNQGKWNSRAPLTLITTPNAPSGRGYSTSQLETLCAHHEGVVVLDEAYVDFADENALPLALKYPHVLVARTFSKAYSLCFLRVGYFVGNPELIEALHKIRDSYNVNGLGQAAALATLQDQKYYQRNIRKIIATREKLSEQLSDMGFEVMPSQTNFLLARPPKMPARQWLDQLRARKILVRWFSDPAVSQYLRITIGTDSQATLLVNAVSEILGRTGQTRQTSRTRRMQ